MSGADSILPLLATDNTDIAFGKFFATKFVPSNGSTAISKSSPAPVPIFSPINSFIAFDFSAGGSHLPASRYFLETAQRSHLAKV